MRILIRAVPFLFAAACGLDQNIFYETYTLELCEHALACSDDATLTFDGILTVDDCIDRRGEDVGAWGAGCKYRGSDAQACLDEMATLTCPAAEGTLAARPTSCESVFFDCSTQTTDDGTVSPPTSGGDDSDVPEDTEAPDDTDASE